MAKNDPKSDAVVVASTEVRDAKGAVVNAMPVSLAPLSVPAEASTLTFPMYCSVRGIAVQRQAGLRAYTSKQSASLSEWDAIFKSY